MLGGGLRLGAGGLNNRGLISSSNQLQPSGTGLSLGVGLGGTNHGLKLQLGGTTNGLGGTTSSTGGGLKLGAGNGGLQLGGHSTSNTGLGGLGLAKSTGTGLNIFNQQQDSNPQNQLGQQSLQSQLILNAIKAPGPSVFENEKDLVLMQFNWLQACSGTGKGLVNHGGTLHDITFTPESLVCRFKTVCYNRLPTIRNEDGLVALQFKMKCDPLISKHDSVLQSVQDIVTKGVSTATTEMFQVFCDSVRPLPDECSEMTIYIQKKSGMLSQRLLATEVQQFFRNTSRKPQLDSLRVTNVYAKTGFTDENLKLYLQNPPPGISNQLWEQSKKDNPDPEKYIPVPIVGSSALLARMKHQDQESKQQQSRLEILTDELAQLKRSHTTAMARVAEFKRKLSNLSHRVLRLMVAQEVLRKSGFSVHPDEEQLRVRLEGIQVELDAPLQFKGRLNELMAQLRMQTQVPGAKLDSRYSVDSDLLTDVKQHLTQQQGALLELVKVIKEDGEDLLCVKEGFEQY
ncbi:nuclear pore complex protein Nup54-like [Halichondria panicea]|uniref:nuclear pore complex protein Nup54-like n=1 Tax=Halichondria panicea TaxID=6063 RepID=UPI00312BA2DA